MKIEMVMPQMGESITEATILKWHKSVGEEVKQDETIVEISTDKVDSEIPSPATGVLAELLVEEGSTVPVKSVIAIIQTDKAAGDAAPQAATTSPEPKSPPAPAEPAPPVAQSSSQVPSRAGERFLSPLVRSLAAQHGLSTEELANIAGSGAQGRLTKQDVLSYLESRSQSPAPAASPSPAAQMPAPAPRPDYNTDGIKVEPMDRMRVLIAEHMVRSKATSPHVYSVAEVDVTNIALWRKQKQSAFVGREGFKLSFTPFFLEATTKALLHFPHMNSSVDGNNVILKRDINLGCAVALGNTGLIVPVIKNASTLNLIGFARSLNDLAARARSKKLVPDETQGGTFTITNLGVFGNIIGCPIINQPQSAILGIGAIKKRPVVVNDMIAIRDIVYLTLSYDHRIIDGSLGGQFLQFMTKYLEGWNMNRELV